MTEASSASSWQQYSTFQFDAADLTVDLRDLQYVNGTLYTLIYREDSTSAKSTYFGTSTDAGRTFNFAGVPANDTEPFGLLVLDSGTIVVGLISTLSQRWNTFLTTDAGETFTLRDDYELNPGNGGQPFDFIQASNGTVAAIGSSSDGTNINLVIRSSSDEGLSWSNAFQFVDPTPADIYPKFVISSGSTLYTAALGNGDQLLRYYSSSDGSTWNQIAANPLFEGCCQGGADKSGPYGAVADSQGNIITATWTGPSQVFFSTESMSPDGSNYQQMDLVNTYNIQAGAGVGKDANNDIYTIGFADTTGDSNPDLLFVREKTGPDNTWQTTVEIPFSVAGSATPRARTFTDNAGNRYFTITSSVSGNQIEIYRSGCNE